MLQSSNSEAMSDREALIQEKGLKLWHAAFLVCGELAGVGVLSLPRAIANAGWTGIAMIITLGATACYTGNLLGKCWAIVEKRWPEYRAGCKYPYPVIVEKSIGRKMKYVATAFVHISAFGTGVVFLIVAAQNMQAFILGVTGHDITLCWYLLIATAVFTPVTWLESPKDFWQLGLSAYIVTFIMLLMVLLGIALDFIKKNEPYEAPPCRSPTFNSLFLAFGTCMFSYGVHPFLPTIQHDMRNKDDWGKSITRAFILTITAYLPVPIVGYIMYGSSVQANVLLNLSHGPVQYICLFLVTGHVLLAANIVWNTLYQEAEHVFGVPNGFGWKRVVVRSTVMLCALFCALSLPHFGVLLDLVGGLTITALLYFFPPLCYYFLVERVAPAEDEVVPLIPLWEKTLLLELLLLNFVGTILSTYSSFYELLQPGSFIKPCYVNWDYLTSQNV